MMACTSAFGTGVDKPNVHFMVIHSPKYNLLLVLQVARQAGRNGTEFHVFFTTAGKADSSSSSHYTKVDIRWQLYQLLYDDRCKVFQVIKYMNGETLAKKYRQIPNQVHCDICSPEGEIHKFVQWVAKGLATYISMGAVDTLDVWLYIVLNSSSVQQPI